MRIAVRGSPLTLDELSSTYALSIFAFFGALGTTFTGVCKMIGYDFFKLDPEKT